MKLLFPFLALFLACCTSQPTQSNAARDFCQAKFSPEARMLEVDSNSAGSGASAGETVGFRCLVKAEKRKCPGGMTLADSSKDEECESKRFPLNELCKSGNQSAFGFDCSHGSFIFQSIKAHKQPKGIPLFGFYDLAARAIDNSKGAKEAGFVFEKQGAAFFVFTGYAKYLSGLDPEISDSIIGDKTVAKVNLPATTDAMSEHDKEYLKAISRFAKDFNLKMHQLMKGKK